MQAQYHRSSYPAQFLRRISTSSLHATSRPSPRSLRSPRRLSAIQSHKQQYEMLVQMRMLLESSKLTMCYIALTMPLRVNTTVRAKLQYWSRLTHVPLDPEIRMLHLWFVIKDFENNAPRAKMSLWKRLQVCVYVCIGAHVILNLIYEPLSYHGAFESIINSTIFNIVPPKIVKATDGSQYQPITGDQEIRLLVIEPGARLEELKCRLINVQSCWRTRYEALSYAWGDERSKRQILLSGSVKEINSSLYDALSDLRYPETERLIWVDALCINQDDKEEKTKQIRLMSDIYSRARHVLVYLGKKDPTVKNAIDSIRRLDWKFIPLYLRRRSSGLDDLAPQLGLLKNLLLYMGEIAETDVDWDHIVTLLGRPWFKRTWVIQEAVLPKRIKVICGDQSIPWAILERVVIAMNDYHSAGWAIPSYHLINDIFARIELMESARQARFTRIPKPDVSIVKWLLWNWYRGCPVYNEEVPRLLDFIWESYSFLCGDPRDKIFGMLGVAGQDVSHPYVKPDYDLSAEEVFRRFVLWELQQNNNLAVLGMSSNKSQSTFSTPSWVPDFTRLDPHNCLNGWRNRVKFHASAALSSQVQISNDEMVLCLKGRAIDILHTVGDESVKDPTHVLHDNEGLDDLDLVKKEMQVNKCMIEEARDIWLNAMKRSTKGSGFSLQPDSIFTKDEREGKLKVNIESLTESLKDWQPFFMTLICSRSADGKEDSDLAPAMIRAFIRLSLGVRVRENQPEAMDAFQARKGLRTILAFTRSRRFAGTESGLAGYVPMRAKKGDTVVILNGADVPFVLRKKDDGRYLLVGECYMHGIMNGEALDTSNFKSEETIFTLD
ncbi:hypothetical protein NM208_g1031 [Fusarium decemcellulare]|uniref:Uncharacterized protein n=1 Tax=Fusarium decemcellulare TaxID=57161 RepID=A0ACC1SXH9_9HYPO|nr:hypothetical protein NM208_g1031 [Fusarium decemcellulare]